MPITTMGAVDVDSIVTFATTFATNSQQVVASCGELKPLIRLVAKTGDRELQDSVKAALNEFTDQGLHIQKWARTQKRLCKRLCKQAQQNGTDITPDIFLALRAQDELGQKFMLGFATALIQLEHVGAQVDLKLGSWVNVLKKNLRLLGTLVVSILKRAVGHGSSSAVASALANLLTEVTSSSQTASSQTASSQTIIDDAQPGRITVQLSHARRLTEELENEDLGQEDLPDKLEKLIKECEELDKMCDRLVQ